MNAAVSDEEYVREHVFKNGVLGSIRGFILAAVDFLSQAIGSVFRNILWSERAQSAIDTTIKHNMTQKNDDKNKEKREDKQERQTVEKNLQKEEKKEIGLQKKDISFYNKILKEFDAEITKDLSKFCFKSQKDAFIVPFDKEISPEVFLPAFWSRDGENLITASFYATVLAAALTEKSQDLVTQIGAGTEEIRVSVEKNNKGRFSIFINDKLFIENLSQNSLAQIKTLDMGIDQPLDTLIKENVKNLFDRSFMIKENMFVSFEESGKIKITQGTKELFHDYVSSSQEAQNLQNTLIFNGKLSPGQAFAITSLFAPNVKMYGEVIDPEIICNENSLYNTNPDGKAYLFNHDGKLSSYQPEKIIEYKEVTYTTGSFSEKDRDCFVVYEEKEKDIRSILSDQEARIAKTHHLNKKDYFQFMADAPDRTWVALKDKEEQYSLFMKEKEAVYHIPVNTDYYTKIISVPSLSDSVLEETIKEYNSSITNGSNYIFRSEKNGECISATYDGNKVITSKELDIMPTGYHYELKESGIFQIPRPHSLSQDDFTDYIQKIEEAYNKTSDCLQVDLFYKREQLPACESKEDIHLLCDLEEVINLALESNDQAEINDDIFKELDVSAYENAPDYGKTTIDPQDYSQFIDENFWER